MPEKAHSSVAADLGPGAVDPPKANAAVLVPEPPTQMYEMLLNH